MTKPHINFLLGMLCAALNGCSLMPNYTRPAAPVPAAWLDNVKLKIATDLTTTDWQDYFPDPRLQKLIEIALENNRDLRIASARIAEAQAQYGIQRADRWPNINLVGSRNASLTPASASVTGTAVQAQRYDVAVSLVSFELDFWGRVSSLNAAAKNNYLATESAQRAFRLSLIAEVANAYLSLLELSERTQLAAENARARSDARELLARRRELGVSGDLEFLQAEGSFGPIRIREPQIYKVE